MRRLIAITLLGIVGLGGSALAQDPNNADIRDIQNGVYPEGTFLTVRDVVVTGLAPFGLWVQEPEVTTGAREGVWCFTGNTPSVEIGEIVDVSGNYEEYFDATEINVPDGGGEVIGSGIFGTVPTPALKTIAEVTTGSATAEDWEMCLVQVDSVEVIRHLQFGEYTLMKIGDPSPLPDTLRCDDRSATTPPLPPVGSQFCSVTGPLDYTFADFKLQPRDNDDFCWLSGEPAPDLEMAYCVDNSTVVVVFDRNVEQTTAEDPINYFFNQLGEFADTATQVAPDQVELTVATAFTPGSIIPEILEVSNVENQAGTPMGTESTTFIAGVNTIDLVQTIGSGLDSSQVAGEVVTVTGVVTGDNTGDYPQRFFIQMPDGGPNGDGTWSGLFVFDRAHLVERGDLVKVAGPVAEFSFKTEIDDPPFVEILSSNNPLPAITMLTAATLSSDAASEPWEGVFVGIANVEVNQDTSFGFGEWTIVHPGETDTVIVGDTGSYTYNPTAGDPHSFIIGPLDYNFFDIKLEPRDDNDITGPIAVGDEGAPGAARTELRAGYPNPFNPSTHVAFNLAAAGRVQVRIYDQSGRLVRTLVDGAWFEPGSHEVQWDGRGDQGQRLASGVYHYRFEAGNVVETRKITLVK